MYDVITFGSAIVDAFAMTDAELICISHGDKKEELIAYASGSKILIHKLDFQIGGGGTNTAVGFARLGFKTAFCGKVGKKENAAKILALLKKEKVDFIGCQGEGQTGYSMVLDSQHDDRTILTFKGVNDTLKYSELDKTKLKARWFYFSSLMGESFNTMKKLLVYAEKNKIDVAFNPSSYLAKKGKRYLSGVLKHVDLLILNKEEAQLLLQKQEDGIKELLKGLSKLTKGIVAITDASNGAYSFDPGTKKAYHIPAKKVRIKETTGAGDAFSSGLLAGLMLKKDIRYGLRLGIANASSVITHIGAKNRLLKKEQLQKHLIKNPRIKELK